MIALLALAAGFSACATAPSKPRPTPADVVSMKDEIHQLARQARDNAPWSKEEVAALASEEAALIHHVNQLAEAAGIATTVAATK